MSWYPPTACGSGGAAGSPPTREIREIRRADRPRERTAATLPPATVRRPSLPPPSNPDAFPPPAAGALAPSRTTPAPALLARAVFVSRSALAAGACGRCSASRSARSEIRPRFTWLSASHSMDSAGDVFT
eukprot:scaffold17456_cov106-Isochrysis_galbana.AAC.1